MGNKSRLWGCSCCCRFVITESGNMPSDRLTFFNPHYPVEAGNHRHGVCSGPERRQDYYSHEWKMVTGQERQRIQRRLLVPMVK